MGVGKAASLRYFTGTGNSKRIAGICAEAFEAGGWSLMEGRRILNERGYDAAYADLVHMPNNWGPFMRVPSGEEAAAMVGRLRAMHALLQPLPRQGDPPARDPRPRLEA